MQALLAGRRAALDAAALVPTHQRATPAGAPEGKRGGAKAAPPPDVAPAESTSCVSSGSPHRPLRLPPSPSPRFFPGRRRPP